MGYLASDKMAPSRFCFQGAVEMTSQENDSGKNADQERLLGIARDCRYPRIRAAAVKRLTDPEMVRLVAHNDPDPSVRLAAIERVTCQQSLEWFAISDACDANKIAAMERLTDPAAVRRVADQSSEPVTSACVKRLNGTYVSPSIDILDWKTTGGPVT